MDFAWDFAKFWDGLCWACTGSEEFKIEAMNQQQKQHLQQVFNRLSGGDDKVVPAHLVAFMREYYANYVKEMSDTSSRRFREVEQEGFSLAVCNRRMAFEDFVAKELAALHDQEIKIVRHPGVDGTLTYFCGVAKDQSGDASELVSRDLRAEFCRIHAKCGIEEMEKLAAMHVKAECEAARVLAEESSGPLLERLVQLWLRRVGTRVNDHAGSSSSSSVVSPESVIVDLEDVDTQTDVDLEDTASSGDETKGNLGSQRLLMSTPAKKPKVSKRVKALVAAQYQVLEADFVDYFSKVVMHDSALWDSQFWNFEKNEPLSGKSDDMIMLALQAQARHALELAQGARVF